MAEKPMTPHERAAGIVRQVRAAENGFLHRLIAEAIQAATKDLETLFAQQAQRADEAVEKLAGAEHAVRDAVATLTKVEAQRDAALAHAAEMRRAITDYRYWFDTCTRTLAENWEERAAAASDALDAALAITPGEALERVRRDARIEALEALPCGYACATEPTTCIDTGVEERFMCPRCRALNAAKGGE